MRRWFLHSFSVVIVLITLIAAWRIMSTTFDLAVIYATDEDDGPLQEIYLWRIRTLESCPSLDSSSPESPTGYVVNAYNMPNTDNAKVFEVLAILIDIGCDINARNSFGGVPLHNPVMAGEIQMVRFLLRNGADPFLRFEGNERNSHLSGLNSFQLSQLTQEKMGRNTEVIGLLREYEDGI